MTLLAGLSLASIAFAADDKKPDSTKPTKEPGTGMEIGAFVHAATADPVLGFFYDKSESVTATNYGGYLMKRSPGGSRLLFDLTYTTTDPKDGPWLGKGKSADAAEWTEFRNFKVYTADLVVGHQWGGDGVFGFFAGGGIGLAVPMGTITSFTTLPPNYDTRNPASAPDKKKIPPVVPTVTFRVGPTFNFGNLATLMVEGGVHTGPYVGVSFGIRLP